MKYPMIESTSPFGGVTYREMLPEEYEERLNFYRNYFVHYSNDPSRRSQEYVSYLRRWFGNESCDGWPNFETRYAMHQLPMSANEFMFH